VARDKRAARQADSNESSDQRLAGTVPHYRSESSGRVVIWFSASLFKT
jgi:hypothetical protein